MSGCIKPDPAEILRGDAPAAARTALSRPPDPDRFALRRLSILSEPEADEIAQGALSLRERWIRRRADIPAFTIGAAAYLDAAHGGYDHYAALARQSNALLREAFPALLEKFRQRLSGALDAPVRYCEGLALPGFHIFLAHPRLLRPIASTHFDLQADLIDWSRIGPVDPRSQLSVTLALRLPEGGGGLRVWDVDHRDLQRMTAPERRAHLAANRRLTFEPYHLGACVIHSGFTLHQIAPIRVSRPGEARITLQAHAIRAEEGWLLYW